ncbi:MAG: prepilin-type N-terminal cleavage/methylation domain-containing protein [Planctomycetes bacterium]|nr:prepilin-type N-terminal cleavage/methylation domain-containing protein [Planctomycetota bacterium]
MPTRAFSLVELLVAMALGLIVAFTAYAGLRVAVKTMAVAQQLSRENRVIAEGYVQGMTEADLWYAVDDPFDAAGQRQRTAWNEAGTLDQVLDDAPGVIGADGVTGQPFVAMDLPEGYWNWNIADPRTWGTQGFHKSRTFQNALGGGEWATGSNSQIGCIGHPDQVNAWMHGVQDRMFSSLGWTGYLDYLPNAQPVCYYLGLDASGQTINDFGNGVLGTPYAPDGWPYIGTAPYWSPQHMTFFPLKLWMAMRRPLIWDTSGESPEKAIGRTGVHLYGISTGFAPRGGWTGAGAAAQPLRSARSSYSFGEWEAAADALAASSPLLSLVPTGWPQLDVRVERRNQGLIFGQTTVAITVTNPTTGSTRAYRFMPIATSLRGARQQRQWSHWGAASLDRSVP